MTQQPQQLATIQQTTEALSVSRQTVYRMIEDGTLAAFRIRNRWRIDLHKFLEALKAQKP